jgi:hypothetical protein
MLYVDGHGDVQEMTLPDERYSAVFRTSQFLLDLQGREDIPEDVRLTARGLLRHYPTYYDLERICAAVPEVMVERYEDLHRFILQGSAAAGEGQNGS